MDGFDDGNDVPTFMPCCVCGAPAPTYLDPDQFCVDFATCSERCRRARRARCGTGDRYHKKVTVHESMDGNVPLGLVVAGVCPKEAVDGKPGMYIVTVEFIENKKQPEDK